MAELVTEFDQLPRSGETVYGFAVGVEMRAWRMKPQSFPSRYARADSARPDPYTARAERLRY